MSDLTRILSAIDNGDARAAAELLPLVYDELRRLAANRLRSEAAGQTLQPTALVHEAYVRLLGADGHGHGWANRGHFFAAAAEAMRRILIDRARAKNAQKRGGKRGKLRLDDLHADFTAAFETPPDELLDLDDALRRLAVEAPRIAKLVELRYFAGLNLTEAAGVLGIARRTAEEDWTYARAWLFNALSERPSEPRP
jgi:RNA polymerase sigma factor (TIGR02999 family)